MGNPNDEEIERYWFQYKCEGEPYGVSLEQFCQLHKIPYNELDSWLRKTKSKISSKNVVDSNIISLLDQLQELRLEIKAIRKLFEESETEKQSLRAALDSANEQLRDLSKQLEVAHNSQIESEHQPQK